MKTLPNNLSYPGAHAVSEISAFQPNANPSYRSGSGAMIAPDARRAHPVRLLTEEAASEMSQGRIPNLEQVCQELYGTFLRQKAPYSALQFIPVLKKLEALDPSEVQRFLHNPQTNHVLVRNDLIKIVLIHWRPGKVSSIHGHAQGGCVFKVLQGKLVEKRYSPDASQELLAVSTFSSGAMAYIDDEMAYHAVGNPFDRPAISLHAYTPGV